MKLISVARPTYTDCFRLSPECGLMLSSSVTLMGTVRLHLQANLTFIYCCNLPYLSVKHFWGSLFACDQSEHSFSDTLLADLLGSWISLCLAHKSSSVACMLVIDINEYRKIFTPCFWICQLSWRKERQYWWTMGT